MATFAETETQPLLVEYRPIPVSYSPRAAARISLLSSAYCVRIQKYNSPTSNARKGIVASPEIPPLASTLHHGVSLQRLQTLIHLQSFATGILSRSRQNTGIVLTYLTGFPHSAVQTIGHATGEKTMWGYSYHKRKART
ncbi:hypothetical protein KIH79_06875 [Bifidobacterium sp. 82T10]|uniref:Uncharacterized protein n=1 Tax=Bifidobacterium miconis TaxID=2834435 RepID=A0ABS6WF79_9BIFI|nr:hypothetical protein [Bifidobacterium miconis]MBW3092673.1 hypothetical protein [Bifidobacterium miconis]